MNPDEGVLVVLLNNRRDWELVEREHWYRIPVRHAPRFFSGAQYLAFYLSLAFGESKWAIHDYAPVRGHELARRRDLIPGEDAHPRAEELYYKIQLGPLQTLEPPIRSKRGRRILFLWTTWAKFTMAREINDLFLKGPAQDKLWQVLRESDLDAERDVMVRDGLSRYRVDLMIYCPRGRLAVTIGAANEMRSTNRLRALSISSEDLENHFERAWEHIQMETRELGEPYSRKEMQI